MIRVSPSGIILIFTVAAGACLHAEDADREKLKSGILSRLLHPNDPVLPSTILGEEMVKVINQVFAEMPADKKKFPEGMTEEKVKAQTIQQIRTAPCVMVTAAEESNFKAGKFDDTRNLKMMKQFKDILTNLKVEIPLSDQVFFKEFDAGKLNGGRLEAAVRSAFMTAGRVQTALEKTEPKK